MKPIEKQGSSRVLIFDTDAQAARKATDNLASLGYKVIAVGDLTDVAGLSDLEMPEIAVFDASHDADSACSLMRGLRDRDPTIHCIALTAPGDTGTTKRMMRRGANDCIAKPIDFELLDLLIARGLDRQKSDAEYRNTIWTLKESEARFRAYFENSPVAMSLKDRDSRFLMINKPYEDWLGRSSSEIVGWKRLDLLADDNRRKAVSALEKAVFETGNVIEQEITVAREDGTIHDRILIKFPVKADDGTVAAIGTLALDNSERKRAERAIAEGEARLRGIIDNYPSLITLKDLDGKYLLVNEAYARARGISIDDAIGRSADEIESPEQAKVVEAHDIEALKSRSPVTYEREWIDADGKKYPRSVTKFPVFDSDGKLMGIGTISTDISQRVEAENALRESEALLRSIIDSSPVPINLKDLEHRFVVVNKAFEKIIGVTADEVIGLAAASVMGRTSPSAVEIQEQRVIETGKTISEERTTRLPNGKLSEDIVTKFPVFNANGNVSLIGTIMTNITERKRAERRLAESEDRFRAVVDNSPTGIALKDNEGRYLMMNRAFREWLNVEDDADFQGKTFRDFFPASSVRNIENNDRLVRERGTPVIQEREVLYPDGVTRKVWIHKFPIFNTDGECSAIGTVNIDVTETRDLEEQLAHAQKLEAVGQLTGGVAHDFNNLLGIILGNLDFLQEALKQNATLLPLVERSIKAALSGANLNRQLLAFSRKQSLSPKVLDLAEHVSGILDMLQRTLGETIEIEARLCDGPLTTEVDPAQFDSMLLNLAVNARDAMPDGGRLTIEAAMLHLNGATAARPELEPGEYILLSVTDTGTGMTPDVLAQAFDPFFTTKEIGQGSGLGLSMVFGFTKQSGGYAEIESAVAAGTTVKVYLPFVSQATADSADLSKEFPMGRGERILIVEDDPGLLSLARKLLHSLNYEVVNAKDANAALAILEETPGIDLILTDVVMPGGMSGPALANEAGMRLPGIKLLFMSGYAPERLMREGGRCRQIPLLQKPFRKAELARTVRSVLDG